MQFARKTDQPAVLLAGCAIEREEQAEKPALSCPQAIKGFQPVGHYLYSPAAQARSPAARRADAGVMAFL